MRSGVKRRYTSPLRRTQAQQTRREILHAAEELFLARGYTGTTVAAIAEAAGVSIQTTFAAVGNKRTILTTLRSARIAGDDEPTPLAERPWLRDVVVELDPYEKLARYAAKVREINERNAPIELVIRAAAPADPGIDALWRESLAQRLAATTALVEHLADRKLLRDALPVADAGDLVWSLVSPEVYDLLVGERGWPGERYETWLAEALVASLLDTRRRPAE
jgi:AcrR family transcriptional regulator